MSFSNFINGLIFDWPISTVIFSLILWFQVKIFMGEIQVSSYQSSYNECIKNRNIYKIVVAPFCHNSHVLALFNLLIVWDMRVVELSYGSIFYLLYSIILLLFETAFFFYIIKFLSEHHVNIYDAETNTHWMSLPSSGYNGLVLSWLGFLSIDLLERNKTVDLYLFSILPIPISFAPIVVWLVFQMW
jgi:hypothetical protein